MKRKQKYKTENSFTYHILTNDKIDINIYSNNNVSYFYY